MGAPAAFSVQRGLRIGSYNKQAIGLPRPWPVTIELRPTLNKMLPLQAQAESQIAPRQEWSAFKWNQSGKTSKHFS